jgi:UPF0716 family protein affecting phage T7 exclusion
MFSLKQIFHKAKADLRSLARGTPGRRFTEYHDRGRVLKRRASSWKTAAYIVGGALLLIAGLLLSLPPGVPGFLLWIPGLTLMIARLRPFAVALDSVEAFIRRLFGQPVRARRNDD